MKKEFDILVDRLKNFMTQTGRKRAVLGLSGGVDSALTLKIAVEALGQESVCAVLMPNETLTNPQNVMDAEEWARALGVHYFIVPILPFFDAYKALAWEPSVLADMNLNSRLRATILYHYANTHDALVLGTGNKTELKLGYFTKYGDGACDVEVIGDLYKTEVWAMSKAVGVPEAMVTKAPSAELMKGQTDEGEMGFTYKEADVILQAMDRGDKPEGAVADKIRKMMQAAQHKGSVPVSLLLS